MKLDVPRHVADLIDKAAPEIGDLDAFLWRGGTQCVQLAASLQRDSYISKMRLACAQLADMDVLGMSKSTAERVTPVAAPGTARS